MMIKAAKRKKEGGRWMRWEGRYLGFGHARAVRESDFHTIASGAQYFSAPLGKVWFSQGQLGYLQIRIIKNITVFLVPGEHAPLPYVFFPLQGPTPSVEMGAF